MDREEGGGNSTPPPSEKNCVRVSFSWGLPHFDTKVKYATYDFTKKVRNSQKIMEHHHLIFTSSCDKSGSMTEVNWPH